MKKILPSSCVLLLFALLAACTKNGNSYSSTDHTVGIIKTWIWYGTSNGFVKGDTIQHPSPDTTHVVWAKAFSRNISDTSFPVIRINGFAVSVLGTVLIYRGTDSLRQTVKFDSTLAGAATSVLTYYYAKDSLSYEYHEVSGYNATQNQYYQVNEYFYTKSM